MRKLISAAVALTIAASAMAQQPVPLDPAVRMGHLDNGLTYYIRHNEEPKGQANFYIAQKVGSILEEENQRGLAHFLEHMCFNGTAHFPGNAVIKYCESIGVKFGANLNAYTSIDETVYNIDNVPVATTPSSVDSCLWILHDWADGLLLTDEDIDHERGVIHEEWRSRMNNASMRLYEKILPELYPGNRYGQRLPIGTMEVVDNFPYQALRDYYEKWYRPDQQGIIVVGDVDVNEIEAKIKEIFGTIAKPENPAERYYVQVEDNEEPIVCIGVDKEQTVATTYIFCKHDDFTREMKADMNYLVFEYATSVISHMLNERLYDMLQTAEPPFLQAMVGEDSFFVAKTKKAFTGMVASSEAGFLKAVTTVYREMLRAARGGFTESEYERARAEILSEIESDYNKRDKKKSADYCSEYVRHFIDNEPAPGIEFLFAAIQQYAPYISVEIINQIMASLVGENNLAVAAMLPEKEGVTYPDAEEIRNALKAVAAENIDPFVEEVSNEPLISELPSPGKIVKTKASKFGYTMYKLSNGATVYVNVTDHNPDEIIMSASSAGGTSLYPEAAVNDVVGDLMTIGGVGNFSKPALMKALAGKRVRVAPAVSLMSESVSGHSTPKDFETMLQLNYLYFTALRADDEAFASWKTTMAASIANRDSQPMSAFQDSVANTIYNNPGRVKQLTLAELETIDYAEALQMAKERFADASDFTFIFTGAIDEETMLPLIERYIGSLPSSGKKEKADTKVLRFTKGQVSNSFDRKMEIPMVTTIFLDNAAIKFNLKNKLAFDMAMSALSTVLLEEIREKEGGTYGISAYGQVSGYPVRETYFQIGYQTDPDRYEYLNQKVREISSEFAANGPRKDDLDKAKEYAAKKYREDIHENTYWESVFKTWLRTGEDMDSDYEAILRGLDGETVRKVFLSVCKKNNHAEVIMRGVKNE